MSEIKANKGTVEFEDGTLAEISNITIKEVKEVKSKSCKYCKETDTAKIEKINLIYHYTNPEAYGFPEVCFWKEEYKINFCPMCGRKLV